MIILDTNVFSEAMKNNPNVMVHNWLNSQVAETLYITSVTLAELLMGIAVMPKGKRKNALELTLDELLRLFKTRILPFDEGAARHYAQQVVLARNAGRACSVPDAYIAGIAAAHGFIVASRDTGPYEAAGVNVINPWIP